MKQLLRVALVGLAAVALPAVAVAPVQAVGLFKDRAMIRVLGQEHYLTVGQSSPEGAQLLAADSTHAVVRYQGETYDLTLTEQIAGSGGYQKAAEVNLSITRDDVGQYRAQGTINGYFTNFLIDTGASLVAISEREARAMNISYQDSNERASVVTAQGQANSYLVVLDSIVVGGIEAHNVRAAVIPGDYPVEVLLGMSFLSQVKMEQQAGVLVLKQHP
jgi:aspartyl protease family protein